MRVDGCETQNARDWNNRGHWRGERILHRRGGGKKRLFCWRTARTFASFGWLLPIGTTAAFTATLATAALSHLHQFLFAQSFVAVDIGATQHRPHPFWQLFATQFSVAIFVQLHDPLDKLFGIPAAAIAFSFRARPPSLTIGATLSVAHFRTIATTLRATGTAIATRRGHHFLKRQFAVVVAIERLERFRSLFDLGRVEHAIAVAIERFQDGDRRQAWSSVAWASVSRTTIAGTRAIAIARPILGSSDASGNTYRDQ